MKDPLYSVFYHLPDGYFVCKTDFNDLNKAEDFFSSEYLALNGIKFHFILKEGKKLVRGEPLENNEKYFADSMMFALDIPISYFDE